MGCFLACFGRSKDRKRRQRSRKSPPINRVNQAHRSLQASPSRRKLTYGAPEAPQSLQANPSPPKPINEVAESNQSLQASASPQKTINEVTEVSVPQPSEKEQGSFISCRKKVTFDPNVKTYEDVSFVDDSTDQIGDEEGGEVKELEESKEKASLGAFPVNHRYQNCENSDDDEGLEDDIIDDELEESECEDEGGVLGTEEESYDSFFSLPIDKECKQESSQEEVESPVPISLSTKGHARDRSQYVLSVLNPVENLSQWKDVKLGVMPKNPDKEINSQLESVRSPSSENSKTPDKENMKPELKTEVNELSPEPVFKLGKAKKAPDHSTTGDISVDASLSTWLVSSQSSPKGSNSQRSNSSVSKEEQPILGALTVEDLKHSSATSSPRRSPIRNPDDIPILGTVGSYWHNRAQYSDVKGTPNTTSKYREDKRVNWHSTPFEVRLERALNKGAAS